MLEAPSGKWQRHDLRLCSTISCRCALLRFGVGLGSTEESVATCFIWSVGHLCPLRRKRAMDNQELRSFQTGTWQDETLAPAVRAALLQREMTLQEKLQQLGSSWPGSEELTEAVAPLQESHLLAASFDMAIRGGLGQITRPFGTAPVDPEDGMRRLADLQRRVMAANRFGIPAIAHEECLTGFTAWGATVYPTSIAWAATFDSELIRRMSSNIGRDLASVGVHQGLAPVLDVVRDYRWGRVEETMGEDPHLVAELGSAYIEGLQSHGVIATLKHFVGYSASRGGRNHAPVSIGPRELNDVLLPPFERAVVEAKARSVMNSYTELDGVPTASDEDLLTNLLRNCWGFDGTVVSDYWAVPFLASMHRLVDEAFSAGAIALGAGIDVELPHTVAFTAQAAELLDDRVIDRAVLRVLTQKAELGLLDRAWQPPEPRPVALNGPNNRDVARTIAEESIILLHNAVGTLPLATPRRIAVIGPAADDPRCLFGCYSFPNHVLPNFPGLSLGIDAPSLLQALRTEFTEAEVIFAPGVPIVDQDASGIERAVEVALAADIVLLVLGDRSGMFGHGTSGEGCDVLDLRLPGLQDRLADTIFDTNAPVVLITVTGRPYAIGQHVERSAAALQAFFPGQEGAAAIAGVLSGRVAPSGRLPIQIPGDASAQPGTYLAPPLALRSDGVSSIDPTPAFPFGFGLTYTDFVLGPALASTSELSTDGTVAVTASVRNVGESTGTAVLQLYLGDPVAEVTRPARQLIGFQRVEIESGEEVEVSFAVSADRFAYTGRDLRRRVEAGKVVLTVAQHAGDPGSEAVVHVCGPTRMVDHTRVLRTPSRVTRGSRA